MRTSGRNTRRHGSHTKKSVKTLQNEQEHMEPELLPSFVEKIKSTEHKKPIKVKNLRDRYK